MAIISVKLKAILNKEIKSNIYEAHELFNEGVNSFEKFLILSQGKDYYYHVNNEEKYCSEEETKADLVKYLSSYPQISDTEKCMESLMLLSEIIRNQNNKSQMAGSLAKLYMEDSTAGTNNIRKIVDPVPEWVSHFDEKTNTFDSIESKKAADDWIASDEGKAAIAPSLEGAGNPSSFKRAYRDKIIGT